MLKTTIPGYKELQLNHLILDYNGTLAYDGKLLAGVGQSLNILAAQIQIHVLTADTFGQAGPELAGISCRLSILPAGNQAIGKLEYVQQLGAAGTVCIGNGRNDRLMLKEAGLGIAVLQAEGAAVQTIMAADLLAPNILAALDLLIHPLRLTATLRS